MTGIVATQQFGRSEAGIALVRATLGPLDGPLAEGPRARRRLCVGAHFGAILKKNGGCAQNRL
jgi:hypothetical protein